MSLLQTYDELLAQYMPPGFLVDEHRELLHCFGSADQLLTPRRGRPSNDILEMVDADTKTAIAGALQRVIRQQTAVHLAGISLPIEGVYQPVKLSVQPVVSKRSHLTHYLITIEPII